MPLSESESMERLFDSLWPIMRSISGDGVRETYRILGDYLPGEVIEVPSGEAVFDWIIPPEWKFRDAFVVDPNGNKILDAKKNTLRLVNYSEPFNGTVSLAELNEHLHSLPNDPTAIPYVTSYYKRQWGFCLSQEERDQLLEGSYKVVVDTEFRNDGSMSMMQAHLPGIHHGEILVSVNTCHPSLANNELSGPIVAAHLYKRISQWKSRNFNIRFVFIPETIGSIAFLSREGESLRTDIVGGLVMTCVGDSGSIHYKRSRQGKSITDRAAASVLKAHRKPDSVLYDFTPWGSDERQYCSPGFNFPMGTLMRAIPGEYPEYHTSHDNKSSIDFDAMAETLTIIEEILYAVDQNTTYQSIKPFGEPKLDQHGLYPEQGGLIDQPEWMVALRWVLNLSDGENDLLSISERSGLPFSIIQSAAEKAAAAGILEPIST